MTNHMHVHSYFGTLTDWGGKTASDTRMAVVDRQTEVKNQSVDVICARFGAHPLVGASSPPVTPVSSAPRDQV